MKMYFDPTRSRCNVLSMILSAPALHKAHSNCTHLSELIDRLKAMINRLRQQLRKLLVVEDLQRAARWNLAHCAGMKAMVMVAVAALHENRRVRETFCIHLSAHVVQMHAFSNVPTSVLDCAVAVHVRQLAQTEPVRVVGRIREAINDNGRGVAVKHLTDTTIQLIVCNTGPVWRFLVAHWCNLAHLSVHSIVLVTIYSVIRGTVGRGWCLWKGSVGACSSVIMWTLWIWVYRAWAGNRRHGTLGAHMRGNWTLRSAHVRRIESSGWVTDVVWHIRLDYLVDRQQGVARSELRVPWH